MQKKYKISVTKAYKLTITPKYFKIPLGNKGSETFNILCPNYYNILDYREIKGEYNKFDRKTYEDYWKFQENKWKVYNFAKMAQLMKNQNYCCELCGNTISMHEYYEVHHYRPKEYKGLNDLSNLIILCKYCHGFVTGAQFSNDTNPIRLLMNRNGLDIPIYKLEDKQFRPNKIITEKEDDFIEDF